MLRVLTKLGEALTPPADVRGVTVSVGVSIGVALFPEDSHEAQLLLSHADAAMYAAKRNRAGPVLFSQLPPTAAAPA